MAASAAMQSFLASPATSRTRITKFVPPSCVPRLPKRANMRIRSIVKDNEKAITDPKPNEPNPAPAPKVSTKFEDVLAFSGPRLAMIGFVTAVGLQIAKSQDIFSQITEDGLPWFIGTSVVLSLASLIPLYKGGFSSRRKK